jgi:hypothetical protein
MDGSGCETGVVFESEWPMKFLVSSRMHIYP